MFPRLADIFIWIARPTYFSQAFNGSWLWPILGIVFLPFTTLMYVLLWSPGIGLNGWDWFWVFMAVILDLMHWSHTIYQNRTTIPGYTGS
jgi:hypothetical protein